MAGTSIPPHTPTNRIPKRAFIYSIFPEGDQHCVVRLYGDGSTLEICRFSSRETALEFAARLPPSRVA